MVFLEDFEEFEAASRALFASNPLRTRLLLKYRGHPPLVDPLPKYKEAKKKEAEKREAEKKGSGGASAAKKKGARRKPTKREQAILKVTDDKVCLKFRTDQMSDLRKIERMCQEFVRWAVAKDLDKIDEPDAELEDAKEGAKQAAAKRKRRKG
mmetsp:Transcript_27874/g.83311  ORF Transcript_27874/g.83311 Transcript_27874/m.83311 type:complete len:153 (-) Transcript_27874:106-564(-)